MKKIFTILSTVLFAAGVFAATEPAWYNDVTSIAANGQYYIYSVNGKGFVQENSADMKTATANSAPSKWTISKASGGTICSQGGYYLKSYELSSNTKGKSPENGSSAVYEVLRESGKYWNIYGYYTFKVGLLTFGPYYAALYYDGSNYDATVGAKETITERTDAQYQFYLISQEHYDRHWAIYLYDRYKESISDYTQWENLVPTDYYTALVDAYAVTYDVKNAEHSAEVVNQAKADLEALYNGAAAVAEAYANAKATINALDGLKDKGEGDMTQINNDITNARQAIEDAMSVEALNAAVSAPALKAIDPITFNVFEFTALQPLGTPASTAKGRTITYAAADNKIINAEGLPIHKGTTKLTATAAATDAYYEFVRSADVTVKPINNTGVDKRIICAGDEAEYQGDKFKEATVKDYTLENVTGGDSIVTLTVIVNQPSSSSEEKTITYGDEEVWNGYALKDSTVGEHIVVFVTDNAAGCDSTVTLKLKVNKMTKLEMPVEFTFCAGGSETFRGKEYTEAISENIEAIGDVRDTTYMVTVTVNQPSATSEEKTITFGDDEEWNGIALKDSVAGVYSIEYVTTNVLGCDSVVTLNLTVKPKEEQGDATGLSNVEQAAEAVKVFRNGVMYIRRSDALYTITGERVE